METNERPQTIIVKQNGGCLSGCLITLLIIVLLVFLAPFIFGIGIFAFLAALIGVNTSDTTTDSKSYDKNNSSYTTTQKDKVESTSTIAYDEFIASDDSNTEVNDEDYLDPDFFSDKDVIFDNINYRVYFNSRFHYSINYPVDFVVNKAPGNGGGRGFTGKNAELSVSGLWKYCSIRELFEQSKKNQHTITYERITKDWFVLSGFDENEKIYYTKTIYKDNEDGGTVAITATLIQGESETENFKKMVKPIFESLK